MYNSETDGTIIWPEVSAWPTDMNGFACKRLGMKNLKEAGEFDIIESSLDSLMREGTCLMLFLIFIFVYFIFLIKN